jgi:peptidoglycan/xylan/chitin deacetylase (PgdA/CDA1 family)
LCLLTFDDGLTEHARDVAPWLAEHGIQGLFFPITSCLENRCVAPVHMNHLLMARLDFATYSREFLAELRNRDSKAASHAAVDAAAARATYIWDAPEVAAFKYLFNFVLDAATRDAVVKVLFEKHVGPESDIADDFYFTWEDAQRMQAAGMMIGGHSHRHRPLSALTPQNRAEDLEASRRLLDRNLRPQPFWPFSYPYGKTASFNGGAISDLQRLGFQCAFTTESGANVPGAQNYSLRRVDCKQAHAADGPVQAV